MRVIQFFARLCISLIVLTIIGQARIGGQSLENRYHASVNSNSFQEAYWALMTPVTYTYSKMISLFKKETHPPMAR